jgi:hypothetical protein
MLAHVSRQEYLEKAPTNEATKKTFKEGTSLPSKSTKEDLNQEWEQLNNLGQFRVRLRRWIEQHLDKILSRTCDRDLPVLTVLPGKSHPLVL